VSAYFKKRKERIESMVLLKEVTIRFVGELSKSYGVTPPKIILIGSWYYPYYSSEEKRITLGHIYPLPLLLHEFRHHMTYEKNIRKEDEYERELDAIRWSTNEAPKWLEKWLVEVYPYIYKLR